MIVTKSETEEWGWNQENIESSRKKINCWEKTIQQRKCKRKKENNVKAKEKSLRRRMRRVKKKKRKEQKVEQK